MINIYVCSTHLPCQKNRTVPISQDGGKTFPRTGAPGRILPHDSNRFLWGSVAYLLQPSNSGFGYATPSQTAVNGSLIAIPPAHMAKPALALIGSPGCIAWR